MFKVESAFKTLSVFPKMLNYCYFSSDGNVKN